MAPSSLSQTSHILLPLTTIPPPLTSLQHLPTSPNIPHSFIAISSLLLASFFYALPPTTMLLNNIQFVETQAPAFDTLSRTTSSTFEKVGRWMFSSDEVDSSGLPEAVCCPCVAYGRTRLRFNEAVDRSYGIYETKEQHQQSPIYPVVTKDCCVFASLCLPCKCVYLRQTSLTV